MIRQANRVEPPTIQSRFQSGMKGVGYALIAVGTTFAVGEAFGSGKCGFAVFGQFAAPYCHGGTIPTFAFSCVLPSASILSARLAFENLKECFNPR